MTASSVYILVHVISAGPWIHLCHSLVLSIINIKAAAVCCHIKDTVSCSLMIILITVDLPMGFN